jgi:hypothetical protein
VSFYDRLSTEGFSEHRREIEQSLLAVPGETRAVHDGRRLRLQVRQLVEGAIT